MRGAGAPVQRVCSETAGRRHSTGSLHAGRRQDYNRDRRGPWRKGFGRRAVQRFVRPGQPLPSASRRATAAPASAHAAARDVV